MRRLSRLSRGVSLALVCFALFLSTSFASGAATGGRGDLVVTSYAGGRYLSGLAVSIYRVADYSGFWTEAFSGYGLRLSTETDSEASALAATLRGLVVRDGIEADYSGRTDSSGEVRFAGVPSGVYLVLGEDYADAESEYKTVPALVVVAPGVSLDVELKHVTKRLPKSERTVRKVVKVWDDAGFDGRPARIKVALLRDGRVFDERILDGESGWRHTWVDLDASYDWDVVESAVPDGYEASVDVSGVTVVITNHLEPEDPPPPENPPPENPPPENPPGIPQTGTTWYLVPVLASAGLALVFLGSLLRGDDRRDS